MTVRVKRTGQVLDAIPFDRGDVYARMGYIGMDLDTGVSFQSPTMPYVLTHAGRKYIADGDWILTGPDGFTDAVSPADFVELVEPFESGACR